MSIFHRLKVNAFVLEREKNKLVNGAVQIESQTNDALKTAAFTINEVKISMINISSLISGTLKDVLRVLKVGAIIFGTIISLTFIGVIALLIMHI